MKQAANVAYEVTWFISQMDASPHRLLMMGQTGLISRGVFSPSGGLLSLQARQEHSSNGTERKQQVKQTAVSGKKSLTNLQTSCWIYTPGLLIRWKSLTVQQ